MDPLQPTPSERSFGEKFFTISCQRVAYTSSLTAHELDPNLAVDVSGSRYRLACRYGDPNYLPDTARTRDPKVAVLMDWHDPMVQAVDLVFPDNELSDLQDYMISILPLTDDDSFPDMVRKGAALLGKLEQDANLHRSLARLEGRVGYRPREMCFGLMREMLHYPKLHTLLNSLLDFVGEGGKGHDPLLALLEAASLELRTVKEVYSQEQEHPVHPSDKERTLNLALDLLLTQDPAFGSSQPLVMVRRDWRGVAKVHPDPASGQLPAPFVDNDKDGLADIDQQLGRYVTAPAGQPVPAPFLLDPAKQDPAPARDALGRALDAGGKPIFDYLDLDTTLVAGVIRDAREIMDPVKRTGTRLLVGLSGLMGERIQKKKVFDELGALDYQGFDTQNAPLLEMIYAALQLFRDPNIDDTLDGATQLLKKHENETARVLGAALDVKDLSKLAKYDSAKVPADSALYDDFIEVVIKIANKDGGALLSDLMTALGKEPTKNLGQMFANYYKYRDVHVLNQSTLKIENQGAPGQAPTFGVLVDRSKPDTGHNRSIQQRLLHIINNTHGMQMCNKEGALIKLPLIGITLAGPFKACELFEVPNGAVLYTESMARLRDASGKLTDTPKGHLRLKTENMPTWLAAIVKSVGEDTILGLLAGIDGMSSHPTTEALNRLMFMDPLPSGLADVQDPAIDIDGHQLNKYHIGSLVSWEVPHPHCSCTFYDAIRPIVQAFADHNAEDLFLDLLSVLHRHHPSTASATHQFNDPSKPDYAAGSAVVTYEPLIVDVLEQTDLMDALNALGPVLDQLKLSDGRAAKPALLKTVAFFADPTKSPNLKYRDGSVQAKRNDGQPVKGGVSPFYLFADAFKAKRAALDKLEPKDKFVVDSWNESTSNLVDIFLDTTGSGPSTQFKNRRLVPAGDLLVNFLRQRIKAHKSKGDLVYWLEEDLPRSIEQKLDSPVVARASDFLKITETDPCCGESPPSTCPKDPAGKPLACPRELIYDLTDYLVDELNSNASFRASVVGIADIVQLLVDDLDIVPVVRTFGKVIDPDPKLGLIQAALKFLKPATAKDTKQSLTKILKNAYKEQRPGQSPMQTLLDLATALHRKQPGSESPYLGPDYQQAFHEAKEFLADQQNGLEKFFEIVKNRCGGPCPLSQ